MNRDLDLGGLDDTPSIGDLNLHIEVEIFSVGITVTIAEETVVRLEGLLGGTRANSNLLGVVVSLNNDDRCRNSFLLTLGIPLNLILNDLE